MRAQVATMREQVIEQAEARRAEEKLKIERERAEAKAKKEKEVKKEEEPKKVIPPT